MKAFIFDLNGTMINDMEYHTKAWQSLFNNELGGSFTWDEVKPQMYGKNPEVLVRMFGPDRFTLDEMNDLSYRKEEKYQQEFLPHLALLPGLIEFLEAAYQQGIPMAIGSAAIPFNIDFVLDNLNIRHYFKAIVSADDVVLSKPHPETFLKAAELLGASPLECVVFEDVPKGAEAAANAGMKAVVLTTTHNPEEFAHLPNVVHFANDFNDNYFKELIN
ncbi:haloacid dehalogenase superfamily, subfamily IA, variant 3 with third motif having DD or ED/beta-phosphoglucomutase family hydrolase [Mucilaginibacter pineti]|uniref:Haloacid dehalogenase superfamily, subfamily IA, variant 3 with third motif having DD or ED/beta-phosphoglucomutase family hydrolase n=1 Tax=Mucilaginibacter pineti TaxID=1391627 RepID=A0A1G6X5T7_9SPHI|nr:HAD family phosphatase [Mucilaginibacter pineti]SDD72695.1 haloacid dehalogenase superfamily, subfamily IA, variant 3 with third motif having DD or ED/beta-phosphoglucomutase family hydrolase [Mucilaginibacter pineti]